MTEQSEHADPLIAALREAKRAGNPVPGDDPQRWQELLRAARRRWNSFAHRHPLPARDTLSVRVEDLARGLLARCSARPRTGSPVELSDCRALAKRLASVLSAPAQPTGTGR